MSASSNDAFANLPAASRHEALDPPLRAGPDEFGLWWQERLAESERADEMVQPLYHYTDAAGLRGIVASQKIWFTSIFHLNDPSEHAYGVALAIDELRLAANSPTKAVESMCSRLADQLARNDLGAVFGFFVASFSRVDDDLGQWRAYSDNGRGFALGLSAHLFAPRPDDPALSADERTFVSPVVYGEAAGRARLKAPIEKAVEIVERTLRDQACATLLRDRSKGHAFIGAMCMELCLSIIWISLTTKHLAYKNEEEVRLIIMGGLEYSNLPIETRIRGGELVPFIRSPMWVQVKGSIAKIMIGPSAAATAEDGATRLLASHGVDPAGLLARSDIPYRAV